MLSATTAAASVGSIVIGMWLNTALGHRPRACLDDIAGPSFALVSSVVMWLGVAAWLTVPAFIVSSLARTWQLSSESNCSQNLFALRMAVVAIAWTVAIADPTGSVAWMLD